MNSSTDALNLHLSADDSTETEGGGDDATVVLSSDKDDSEGDKVSPNSKVTWRQLSQVETKCGPVLTDLKIMFPNISWASGGGPISCRVVGRRGQQVQIITKRPQRTSNKK